MKKVLCLFDYGPQCMTGFATVSRNIIHELKRHFGNKMFFDIVATNYFTEPYTEYDGTVRVFSAKVSQRKMEETKDLREGDKYGRLVFIEMLMADDYDIVFLIGDLGGSLVHIIPFLRSAKVFKQKFNRKNFKTILYFPVDGTMHEQVENLEYREDFAEVLFQKWKPGIELCSKFFSKYVRQIDELRNIDTAVTYTNYGRNEILRHNPELAAKIKYVYHGINLHDFYPLPPEEIQQFRKEYFGDNANKYIVGLVNRNQYRKDIPTSILGFIEAKKNWDQTLGIEPFLYLHMAAIDDMGWKLRDVFSQTELVEGKDFMFSTGDHNGQVGIQTLNQIYNSLDVYLTTATGGGWELVSTEMFACKIPCIQPKHTSLGETGADGRAYLLEEFLPIVYREDCTIRNMCHYEEVGEKIREAALDFCSKDYMNTNGKYYRITEAAYNWITKLTWENVCKKWVDIFEKV